MRSDNGTPAAAVPDPAAALAAADRAAFDAWFAGFNDITADLRWEAVKAALARERERLYDIVLRAPYQQPQCEEDSPDLVVALKAMAFDITLQIRGYVPPDKAGEQKALDFGGESHGM